MLEVVVLLTAPLVLLGLGIAVDVWNPIDRQLRHTRILFDQADATEMANPASGPALRKKAEAAAEELAREFDARHRDAPRKRAWTLTAGITLTVLAAVLLYIAATIDTAAWHHFAGAGLYLTASYPYFRMARDARLDALDLDELRRRTAR